MGDSVKTIVNFKTVGTLNPAEITFQVSSSSQNAVIDWTERNYEELTLEIWTGPGSTGSQLILDTDYSLSLRNDFVSDKSGEEIYSGVNIINATYHDVDLYVPINTLKMYGDFIDESDINRLQVNINEKPTGITDQLCKVWCNLKGTITTSIRDSYNTSSFVRDSLGTYTVNFTNNFTNAGFSVGYTAGNVGSTEEAFLIPQEYNVAYFKFTLENRGSTLVDRDTINLQIFGS